MPRITKSGPVRFMATKLYLITSTVATGVGGGFLFPVVPPWLDTPHRGSAVLKNGKVVPTAPLTAGLLPRRNILETVGQRFVRTHTPVETAQDPAMRGDGR